MLWNIFSGRLWAGLAVALVTLSLASNAAAKYKALYEFQGGTDGAAPWSGVVFDRKGNLYGATRDGGNAGYGTIFKLAPNPDGSWSESVLYSFRSDDDGRYPYGLVLDAAGSLYGTSSFGYPGFLGTVFKLTPNPDGSWEYSLVFRFGGESGAYPYAGVTFDPAGNLLGTTGSGGHYGFGTVFKLQPNPDGSWSEKVLYSFRGGADGDFPDAGAIFDVAGNVYGTTYIGGSRSMGTAFRLEPSRGGSWTKTRLHEFKGADGAYPHAGLTFDAVGNLYGTTSKGSVHNKGTVFKLTPNPDGSWRRSKLHNFNGADGAYPDAGLTFDAAGNLYGTTSKGGTYNSGTVFRMTPQPDGLWKLDKIHTFKNHHLPMSGLVVDGAGNLYGTTMHGGIKQNGVVFEIAP